MADIVAHIEAAKALGVMFSEEAELEKLKTAHAWGLEVSQALKPSEAGKRPSLEQAKEWLKVKEEPFLRCCVFRTELCSEGKVLKVPSVPVFSGGRERPGRQRSCLVPQGICGSRVGVDSADQRCYELRPGRRPLDQGEAGGCPQGRRRLPGGAPERRHRAEGSGNER